MQSNVEFSAGGVMSGLQVFGEYFRSSNKRYLAYIIVFMLVYKFINPFYKI